MGTLAIRQGDVLFFARSLVWRRMAMAHDEFLDQPDRVRFDAYTTKMKELQAMGSFTITQEDSDRIAAMYNVTPLQVKPRENPVSVGKVATRSQFKNRGGF